MRFVRSVAFSVLFAGLGACANVTAVPVTNEIDPDGVRVSSYVEGIRIPDCKPLIAVAGNAISVIWVKNPDKELALRFSTFLAKHDFSVEFTNQCLSKLTSNQDTTAVPIAFINLLSKALETGRSIGEAFSGKMAEGTTGRLQLFDLVFDGQGNLMYLRPLIRDRDLIRVPVASAAGAGQQPGKPAEGDVNKGDSGQPAPGGQKKNNSK